MNTYKYRYFTYRRKGIGALFFAYHCVFTGKKVFGESHQLTVYEGFNQ